MVRETILHIDEELNDEGRQEMLKSIRDVTGGAVAHHHSEKPHMLVVAYDDSLAAPHQLAQAAAAHGYRAQVVDL